MLYIIYSIIFLINIYIRDFIHFLKRIIFKTKDENSNYCIPLINSDSVLTDDPFVLSMLYSIYIDINEEEIKKKEKKSGNSENNFALVYMRLNPSAFLQYSFKEITKNLFLIHNKPMHKKYSKLVIIKIILIILVSIYSFIIHSINLSLIIIFLIFIISLPIQISPWFHHKIYKCFHPSTDDTHINIYQIINLKFKGFKYINYASYLLFFLSIIVLAIFSFLVSDNHEFSDINETFNRTGLFTPRQNVVRDKNSREFLKSAMCLTKFHGLDIIQIASLAQITYYDDIEQIKFYLENSVFNSDNIKISDMKIISKKNGILIMTDIDIKNKNGVRVFSVRGTKAHKDKILDAEIFASSATLTLMRKFPLFGNTESYFVTIISGLLTYPLRNLKDFTLTNLYMKELSENYEKYNNTNRNIIFTGHSLGGGLAKYMGIKYNKQSISFSGPGVTPLEYEYSKNQLKKNYIKQYFVDVVPDNDLIPRFETTSGTIYRVICEESLFSFKCHSIDRTFCMLGLMCHEEDYIGNICKGIFDDKELKKMQLF